MAEDGAPMFIRLRIPEGLEGLLEGLAREVLRHQPHNIIGNNKINAKVTYQIINK